MDSIVSFVEEQVGLCGLSGIEIGQLWSYIEKSPLFNQLFYKSVTTLEKSLILYRLSQLDNVEFYCYDKRAYQEMSERKSNVVGISRQIKVELPGYVDLKANGIQGYCPFNDHLSIIPKEKLAAFSSKEFESILQEKYRPNTVVIIGSQDLRDRCIMRGVSADYSKWSKTFYVLVELLARAQYNGMFQKDFLEYKFNSKTFYFATNAMTLHDVVVKNKFYKNSIYFKQESWIVLKRFYLPDEHQCLKAVTNNSALPTAQYDLYELCQSILSHVNSDDFTGTAANNDGDGVTVEDLVNFFCAQKYRRLYNTNHQFTPNDIKMALVILYDVMLIEFHQHGEIMPDEEVLAMFYVHKMKKHLMLDALPAWMKPDTRFKTPSAYWKVCVIDKKSGGASCRDLRNDKKLKTLFNNNTPLLRSSDFLANDTCEMAAVAANQNRGMENFLQTRGNYVNEFSVVGNHLACVCASKWVGFSLPDVIDVINIPYSVSKSMFRIMCFNKNVTEVSKQIGTTHVAYLKRKELISSTNEPSVPVAAPSNITNERRAVASTKRKLPTKPVPAVSSASQSELAAVLRAADTDRAAVKIEPTALGAQLDYPTTAERKNLVLQYLTPAETTCLSRYQIRNLLLDNENSKGITSKICRKTVIRMLNLLVEEERIKVHSTRIFFGTTIHEVCYYSLPELSSGSELVRKLMYDELVQLLNSMIKEDAEWSANSLNDLQVETIRGILCKPFVVDGNKLIERIIELGKSSDAAASIDDRAYLVPTSVVTDEIMQKWLQHSKNILIAHHQVLKKYLNVKVRTQSPFPRYLIVRMMYFYLCVYLFGSPSDELKSQIANFTKSYTDSASASKVVIAADLFDMPRTSFVEAYPWALLIHPRRKSQNRSHSIGSNIVIEVKDFVDEMPFILICYIAGIMSVDEYLEYINNTDLYLVPFKKLSLSLQKILVSKLHVHARVFARFQMLFVMNFVGVQKFDKNYYGKDSRFCFNSHVVIRDTVCTRRVAAKPPATTSNQPLQYFEEISYNIENLLDAIKLWDDLKHIATNTCYAAKNFKYGKFMERFNVFEYAIDYVKRNHLTYSDDLVVQYESDGNGVAGFDSRLLLHLKRSWIPNLGVYSNARKRKEHEQHFCSSSDHSLSGLDEQTTETEPISSGVKTTKKRAIKKPLDKKTKVFVEDNRPFSPQEDALIYVVALSIEIVGNKSFIMYYWKVAKNHLVENPVINKLLERRSLKILHQRSQTLNASTKSLDFMNKVQFLRNYKNIPLLLEEIKIFNNIDSNFESIIEIVREVFCNITLETVDVLPDNITVKDVFNTAASHTGDDFDSQLSKKHLNFEFIPRENNVNHCYKSQLNDNISAFGEVSEACLLNLTLKRALFKLTSNECLNYLSSIGQRKLINAISKVGSSGIFQRLSKFGLYTISSSIQNDTVLKSIFDLPLGLNYVKTIRVLRFKSYIDRDKKFFDSFDRLRDDLLPLSVFTDSSKARSNQNLEDTVQKPSVLCQNHLQSHDLSRLLRMMACGDIRINLLPPTSYPEIYSAYTTNKDKNFYFSDHLFTTENYTFCGGLTVLSDINTKLLISKRKQSGEGWIANPLNRSTTTMIDDEELARMPFSVSHLSAYYDLSSDCVYPRKFFYGVKVEPLPQLSPFTQSLPLSSDQQLDESTDCPIAIEHFYQDYSKPLELQLDRYYGYIKQLAEGIFSDVSRDNRIPHDLTQFVFYLLCDAQSAGMPLNKVISETLNYFAPVNKAISSAHVNSLVQLLIACGLLVDIPLDVRHIVHSNYANQWHITVDVECEGASPRSSSFVSRPWIDHQTGSNSKRMCTYMLTLFKNLIHDRPGLSKAEVVEHLGRFLHNTVVEEMLTLLECDLLVDTKRYPRKEIQVEIFGSPKETYNGFEDCYNLHTELELSFVYPHSTPN